jgi:hypothetical protein
LKAHTERENKRFKKSGNIIIKNTMIQVDIGGHPPSPTGPKHVSGNFGNLLFLAVFNFRGHFEALNDVF